MSIAGVMDSSHSLQPAQQRVEFRPQNTPSFKPPQQDSNPTSDRPKSSSSAKALLMKALLEAQAAVQMDNEGDIDGALEAYNRAVALLSKVMEASSSADEQERLRAIVSIRNGHALASYE
ncbi:hypothetical protein BGZ72_002297 [Mortierella alpina]|nr:hypothetical protein BGZ72_002297 [Mortierella alpina]